MVSRCRPELPMPAASPATRRRGSRSPMWWRRASRSRLQPDQIKDSNAVATTGSVMPPDQSPDPALPRRRLEAKAGHEVSAFILDHVGTFRALESGLGIFVAERRGFLVIRLGSA